MSLAAGGGKRCPPSPLHAPPSPSRCRCQVPEFAAGVTPPSGDRRSPPPAQQGLAPGEPAGVSGGDALRGGRRRGHPVCGEVPPGSSGTPGATPRWDAIPADPLTVGCRGASPLPPVGRRSVCASLRRTGCAQPWCGPAGSRDSGGSLRPGG